MNHGKMIIKPYQTQCIKGYVYVCLIFPKKKTGVLHTAYVLHNFSDHWELSPLLRDSALLSPPPLLMGSWQATQRVWPQRPPMAKPTGALPFLWGLMPNI